MAWRVNYGVNHPDETATFRLDDGRKLLIRHRGDHIEFDAASPEAEALRQIEQWLLAASMAAGFRDRLELAKLVAKLHELAPPQPD